MANHYNPNEKFVHQSFKDDSDPELQSRLAAQAVQNECSAITAQALAALAAPETPTARRNHIAEGFAFAFVMSGLRDDLVILRAIKLADALIAELDK